MLLIPGMPPPFNIGLGKSGGVVASPILILDQFTDTNGTALASHTIAPTNTPATSWTDVVGSWEIQSNKAKIGGSGSGQNPVVVDAGAADVSVTATVTLGASGDIGIIVNYQDGSNYYLVRLFTGAFDLLLAPGFGTVADSGETLAAGTYTFKVVTNGDNIKVYKDGVLKIDYTTAGRSLKTETEHGLRCFATDTTSTVDDFTITTP